MRGKQNALWALECESQADVMRIVCCIRGMFGLDWQGTKSCDAELWEAG